MITKFSSRYYLGEMYIEPLEDDGAEYGRIRQAEYDVIRQELYGDLLTEPPLVIKLDTTHILIKPDKNVPENVIQIDRELIKNASIKNPPSLKDVFFLTKEAVSQFNELGFFPDE